MVALFFGMAVFAQSNQQLRTPMAVQTRFGIKGGVNLAKFKVNADKFSPASSAPNTDSKTSYNAGAFVNIPLSSAIRFQPELVFSSQGSKMNGSFLGATYSREADLHYLNLPLMFQAQTTHGFFVETGPQLGYLLSAKSKNQSGTSNDKVDIKDYLDKFDFSWGAGIGYMSRIGLAINARYNYGLTNVIDDKNTNGGSNFFENGELKNRVIQIGLSYQFGAYK